MYMKIFDVTIDLETCSLEPNAAVLQVAAVAWQRNALASEELFFTDVPPFDAKVDLRSCVMDGFDFDRDTCRWWSQQPEQLRQEIAGGDCYPVNEVFDNFIQWLTEVKTAHKADTLCIWSQGADFDIAILRNVLRRYNLSLPTSYRNFRDARTFIAEVGSRVILSDPSEGLADHNKIYESLPPFPEKENVHNALFDARRTSWSLWNIMSRT